MAYKANKSIRENGYQDLRAIRGNTLYSPKAFISPVAFLSFIALNALSALVDL